MLDDGSLKLLIPEPCLQYSRHVSSACYAARTRRQMQMDLIIRCENENLDWRSMTLDQGEVESTRSRDSRQDVAAAVGEITREMLNDPRFDPEQ